MFKQLIYSMSIINKDGKPFDSLFQFALTGWDDVKTKKFLHSSFNKFIELKNKSNYSSGEVSSFERNYSYSALIRLYNPNNKTGTKVVVGCPSMFLEETEDYLREYFPEIIQVKVLKIFDNDNIITKVKCSRCKKFYVEYRECVEVNVCNTCLCKEIGVYYSSVVNVELSEFNNS